MEEESLSTSEDEISGIYALGLFSELDVADRELLDQVNRIKKENRYGLFGPNLKLKDFGVNRPSNGSSYPL